MKKITLFLCAIATALTVSASQVNIVWDSGSDWTGVDDKASVISYTYKGITITIDKASGGTNPTVNANYNDCRAYANNTVRMTSEVGNMSKMVFHISTQGLKRLPDVTATVGNVTIDATNATVTWVGDAADVTFTVGAKAIYGTDGEAKSGQFDFNSIDVTTSGEAPSVTMPTFSLNGGTFYEPVTVEISCSTEGAAIYYTTDGTTPDATKSLYELPITLSSTTTLKAIAIKGSDVSNINEVTYTITTIPEVATIAEFLATNTTEAAKEDVYRITSPVTVIYQYDRYMYVTDGTTTMLVYGSLNNSYQNGDVLTGICGSVGYYYGYQMVPVVSTFGTATAGSPVSPQSVSVNEVTVDMVNQYIELTDVTVEQEKTFTDETGSIAAYKRFDVDIPAIGTDTYKVKGFVSVFKGAAQIYPCEITNTTSLISNKAENNRPFAANGYIKTTGENETVNVYNVTGKLVATGVAGRDIKVANKGIYIVKVGNKATKVVVR